MGPKEPLGPYSSSESKLNRAISQRLGQLCEITTRGVLEKRLRFSDDFLKELKTKGDLVREPLTPFVKSGIYRGGDAADNRDSYLEFIAPDPDLEKAGAPREEIVSDLIEATDHCLSEMGIRYRFVNYDNGVECESLMDLYYKLGSMVYGGCPLESLRYLIETCLVINRLVVDPGKLADRAMDRCCLKANIPFSNADDQVFARLDGFLSGSPPPLAENGTISSDYLLSNPWALLEIKTAFARRRVGEKSLRRLPHTDFAYATHQIGLIALMLDGKNQGGNVNNLLPQFMRFVYLRGILDFVYFNVPVDSRFIEEWMKDLKVRFETVLPGEENDRNKRVEKILLSVYGERFKHERVRTEAEMCATREMVLKLKNIDPPPLRLTT